MSGAVATSPLVTPPAPPCPDCAAAVDPVALVHAHRAALVALARREGLHGEEALDVVQDAFGAWLALPAERRHGRPDLTLRALTRNLARNRRRAHALARPHLAGEALDALDAPGPPAEERLIAAEEHERLACCVGRLADLQRAVLRLRLLDEVAGADVARQLGLTPGHVAVLLHRARASVAACMSTPHPEPSP